MTDDDLFAGPGQVAALLRARDWTGFPLGPPASWPPEWRAAIRIMLASAFPVCVTLGRDGEVASLFHNDAYLPIVAEKFPRCLASPTSEVWPEIDERYRLAARQARTAEASSGNDLPSRIYRHGRLEEVYFSFSTSVLWGEGRTFMGYFTVVVETTARVLAERRLACLRDLSTQAFDAPTVDEACRRAAAVLDHAPDVPAAILYVVDDEGTGARRVATAGAVPRDAAALRVASLPEGDDPLRVAEVVRTRSELPVPDLGRLCGSSSSPAIEGFAMPILERVGDRVGGVLVAAATPMRPPEEVREFLRLVAAQLATAYTNARGKQHAERREQELAELNRAKTEFLANVSHELRTPLTLLLGPLTEVLAAGRLRPEDRALLDLARRGATRMKKLIKTLLDFSRVEAGRVEPHFEPTDLSPYTRELASMFASAFEGVGLRFVVDAPPLPEPVLVDREMWEKIVLNLLSNALKFTFEGEVRLVLRRHDQSVRLTVSDTGCGIAADELPRVFERYHRAEAPRARTREGSGIGLSLVRELARLHGGGVTVESELGRGTTFHVTLPLGTVHLPAKPAERRTVATTSTFSELFRDEALGWLEEAAGARPRARTATLPPSGAEHADARAASSLQPSSSCRILLVDDNAAMRSYLGRILGQRWTVQTASDGTTALALARESAPDLIVSDVMMPGLDGFALIDALRADRATAAIPVVLVSARAGEEAIEQALTRGAADYVVKPFSARELVARVQVQLTQARLQRSERAARELAEQESRARERFLAVLSHELRAPLGAILGWTELLGMGRLGPEDARRALGVIEQSVDMQKRLIEDLLDVSRVVAGRLPLEEARIETLAPQLEAVVSSFRLAAAEKSVRLEAAIEPASGPLWGDAQRLQQVATNLVGNAIKFTPPGGAVQLGAVRGERELVLSVRDTGKGIAPEALPHVFDDFWMASQGDGRRGGLGLGLAIARSIVTQHGGSIHADSAGEGHGATFTVRLPLSLD